MNDFLKGVLLLSLSIAMIYGTYWVLKHGSYFFFYESMVQETIREMVNSEYLK